MTRLLTVWLVSLAVVAAVAATISAQRTQGFPRVIAGGDLAFRAEGLDRSGKVIGTWVIRVDGEWRELSNRGGIVPAAPHVPVEPR